MPDRLPPWRRVQIAVRMGIVLKPSGKTRWTATAVSQGTRPKDSQTFQLAPFEADSETEAARVAAELIARHFYGLAGGAGFINRTHAGVWMASIGVYRNRAIEGRSISIVVEKVGDE